MSSYFDGADGEWFDLDPKSDDLYDSRIGPLSYCRLGDGRVGIRATETAHGGNVFGALHGGYLAGLAEKCFFLPLYVNRRVPKGGIVVIEYSVKFLGPGIVGEQIDGEIELLKETGKLGFVRGTLSQAGEIKMSFEGTVRKVAAPAP